MPGRVALMLSPGLLQHAVERLPRGVVFVTGSNGKSTTTHMLVEIVRAHGVSVFSNPTGGNLPQGIASSVIASCGANGRIDADIAILEVDEAYAPGLAHHLRPRMSLLLNIQVDQLNRFYEPERVADMLRDLAGLTSDHLILNADDDYIHRIGEQIPRRRTWFGVAPDVRAAAPHGLANVDIIGEPEVAVDTAVSVTAVQGRQAVLSIQGEVTTIELPSRGLHYAVDAAAATAAAAAVLGTDLEPAKVAHAFASLTTVYGRGEVITHEGEEIEIIMMKNPPSLQMNLDYLGDVPEQVFMAIDEGTPDPSWLYGIDFSNLRQVQYITGTKAWQLATCLSYQNVQVGVVEPDLATALAAFLALPKPARGQKTMIVNYEQMMFIRRLLDLPDLEGDK